MSRRAKLEKFAEVLEFPNVFELTEPGSEEVFVNASKRVRVKGMWRKNIFANNGHLCLELACGKGDYTIGLAAMHPDRNYVGVDIKGARIWRGAKTALESGMQNVAFLRVRIEFIDQYFLPGEVDEIWITFPDPYPSKANRRLTSFNFLDKYNNLLRPGGLLHLKTDDDDLFHYSIEEVNKSGLFSIKRSESNIYGIRELSNELAIRTQYEKRHLATNKTIKYLLLEKKTRPLQHNILSKFKK